MDRDRRLTGYLRGQTDSVEAPEGFNLSNAWRVGITPVPHISIIFLIDVQLVRASYRIVVNNDISLHLMSVQKPLQAAE